MDTARSNGPAPHFEQEPDQGVDLQKFRKSLMA